MTGEASRQRWARTTGLLYLATNASATGAFVLTGRLIAPDPARTAANIAAWPKGLRIALAGELVTIAGVLGLIAGLYVLLAPVNRGLALLALLWRSMENALLAAITLTSFAALAILARGGDSGLAFALLGVHGYGFQLGFLFLGLGSAMFSWLWLKSRLIPAWLAVLGLFASALMAAVALAIIVSPAVFRTVGLAYMAPMGFYEIGLGLWLLVRGVAPAAAEKQTNT
jgi:Domain of unknown function (DUF4386)